MRVSFQRHAAGKLDATYHFVFTGNEPAEATVTIHEGQLSVEDGLLNKPNLKIIADSETWLGILAGERNLLWALITRRVRLQGNPKWRSNAVYRRKQEDGQTNIDRFGRPC